MSNEEVAPEEASENEGKQQSNSRFGKKGKIFLLAGIVLLQAAAAYAVVSGFYPEMKKFTAQFESEGGVYYAIENVIINPAGSNGERYLIMSLTVELDNGSALTVLNKRSAEVQDRLNTAISTYTADELSSLSQRDKIKKELGIVINDIIDKKSVRNLFFTKYVLQ